MTQREASIIRRGILKAGYKINVLYSGPTSVTIRLLKKANKTWTPAFRGSSEKNILGKLSTLYPMTLSKKDKERLAKYKAKAAERRRIAEEQEKELEAAVAAQKEEAKKNRPPRELRTLCAAV